MRHIFPKIVFLFVLAFAGCNQKQDAASGKSDTVENSVRHAKGLQIYHYDGYSVVRITNPWPDATEKFDYVLYKKGVAVPDSLSAYTAVQVPIKSVVVTSTTHIPSLEMLGVENTLVAFPNTTYISSEKTRALVDAGKVKEVGANESLNTEVMIDLAPDAVVGFSISSNNKTLTSLQQSGLKVIYNGDWTEQSPLGKAEWIKFFGALYDRNAAAEKLFDRIEKDYNSAKALADKATTSPTVLCGSMYQDIWYMPQGGSWGALFLKDAHANYLWANEKGTGSLHLSLEKVLDRAVDAQFWVGPTEFTSLKDLAAANQHYTQFRAFKEKNVYSFSSKKGKTGGVIYYELAPNRPDLVLKDLIKILHPDLLPDYQLHFFEKLK
ncbi:MAG: ABC transporter substrate-binding protein [Flavobacterium sp.]|nr:MAG: ABC transporter substrate-binding protein [Flavobacterium sp.]